MSVKRVTPAEAAELVAQGWKYVDVRSIPEFEAGHPEGAYNVPLLHMVPGRGMSPNPQFAAVMERRFDRSERLVLGCRSGQRSLRAAEMLLAAGWTDVVDMRGGYEGETDPAGRPVVPGWRDAGLPVESEAPGRSWRDLSG